MSRRCVVEDRSFYADNSCTPSPQADHKSVVKAVYDYDASAPGELSMKEDEVLYVYDKDEDWLLVQSGNDDGKVGFVPGTYVEEVMPSLCELDHI